MKKLIFAGALIGLLAALAAPIALPQGVAVIPKNSGSPASAELQQLKAQLELLDIRVKDLEDEGSDVIEAGGEEDAEATAKKLEQRLASLEKALAERKDDTDTTAKSKDVDNEEGLVVRAPFVVLDDSGHTLFRIDVSPDVGGARVVIGNPVGGRITLVAGDDNVTSMTLRDNSNIPRVSLEGHGNDYGSSISVRGKENTIAGLGEDYQQRFGLFLFRGEVGSVTLTSRSTGSGYLALTNSSGSIVAEGGSKENGIGIFRTGPSCCLPPGAMGPHQYIVGKPD